MTRDLRRATAALIATTMLLVGGVASASADDIDDRRAAAERRQSEILGNREQLQSELDMQAMAEYPASSPATIDYAGAFNVVGRKQPRSNTGRSLALNAHIDVEEAQVLFYVDLPPALGCIQPIVEGAIRQQSGKLLAPPSS